MYDGPGSETFEPGDLVSAHVDGEWLDGKYLGFVPGAGHVVQIDRQAEIVSREVRRRGGWLA